MNTEIVLLENLPGGAGDVAQKYTWKISLMDFQKRDRVNVVFSFGVSSKSVQLMDVMPCHSLFLHVPHAGWWCCARAGFIEGEGVRSSNTAYRLIAF